METHCSSFSSFKSYLRALSDTPNRLRRRACSPTSTAASSSPRSSGANLKRTLRWYDLVGFGVGGMVGAGVFITTGHASRDKAGPAVVISYAIGGLCALLSAFCYTEFAVDMPVAGGAFTYIGATFGELLAFLTGANLVADYVLSNAAVARGFTAYIGTAVGVSTATKLRITLDFLPNGYNEIDILAAAVVLLLTLVICYSTRESSWLNMTLTLLHIALVVFVIVIGFCRGDPRNFTEPGNPENAGGFFPYGASGVFNGAAVVYLSYIGYDAVSTMAEEVRDPVRDIPIGVSGSVILVTILYCAMAASMSALLPYDMIDAEAPFAGALAVGRWQWASRVIGVGASLGILTSLMVAMLGQARYMCVIGRTRVVPAWFGVVHASTATPVNASVFLGMLTAGIALFTDLDILLNLVSIGMLFVFYMVANAVVYRRHVISQEDGTTTNPYPTLCFMLCFTAISTVFTLTWHMGGQQVVAAGGGNAKRSFVLGSCIVAGMCAVQIFQRMVPETRKPEFWGVPWMPWIPSISIFLNIFLLGSLDTPSYVRFGIFVGVALLVYIFYSVHSSFDAAAAAVQELAIDDDDGIRSVRVALQYGQKTTGESLIKESATDIAPPTV